MNIAFIGGVKFSHDILSTILKFGWNISVVFTYLDSKKNNYSDFSDFDDLSKKYSFQHVKVDNINDSENIELLKKIKPDLILVMGWSQLLKNDILTIPRFGVIGSHPTQLPKYRGRAPIPWTILKKLKHSALTFFFIEEGIDDGDILDQKIFEIDDDDDATSLYDKITILGEQMIIDNLNKIKNNTFLRKKQNTDEFIENWPKRTPDDGKIYWNKSSNEIQTLVRATTYPYPGAFAILDGKHIKIWKIIILDESFETPGKIIKIDKNGVQISTINSSILILQASTKEECNLDQIFSKNDIGKLLL
jgi:methionyl-tRNA formyltransferase